MKRSKAQGQNKKRLKNSFFTDGGSRWNNVRTCPDLNK